MKLSRAAATLLAVCMALQAHAHAFLERADPPVGSKVQTAPKEMKLWFSEEIEPAFSTVKVLDAGGKRIEAGDAKVDKQDRKLLHVSLPPLAPGKYTVVWRVVSVDTHVTSGDHEFSVGK